MHIRATAKINWIAEGAQYEGQALCQRESDEPGHPFGQYSVCTTRLSDDELLVVAISDAAPEFMPGEQLIINLVSRQKMLLTVMVPLEQDESPWVDLPWADGRRIPPRKVRGSYPQLRPGDIVEALRDLDPKGANVSAGQLGVVFGAANCYEDGAGPIVRWLDVVEDEGGFPLHQVDTAGVCNVYTGDVSLYHKAER